MVTCSICSCRSAVCSASFPARRFATAALRLSVASSCRSASVAVRRPPGLYGVAPSVRADGSPSRVLGRHWHTTTACARSSPPGRSVVCAGWRAGRLPSSATRSRGPTPCVSCSSRAIPTAGSSAGITLLNGWRASLPPSGSCRCGRSSRGREGLPGSVGCRNSSGDGTWQVLSLRTAGYPPASRSSTTFIRPVRLSMRPRPHSGREELAGSRS